MKEKKMDLIQDGATIPGVSHHRVSLNGTELHYVSAGTAGSPVLLVHGFPETWRVCRKLIPLLSERHRVFAVDLRGFGDSATATGEPGSATSAEDLSELITRLDIGPVHLTGQDISGPATFRVAATHPELVRSYAAIETGLPGFGLEMLLAGRERAFIAEYAIPSLCATPGAFTGEDIDELTRSYSRPGGFRGATGLYRSMLREGDEIRELATQKLGMPVLAVGGGSGEFTPATLRQGAKDGSAASLGGIGHYAAVEAPQRLAGRPPSFPPEGHTPRQPPRSARAPDRHAERRTQAKLWASPVPLNAGAWERKGDGRGAAVPFPRFKGEERPGSGRLPVTTLSNFQAGALFAMQHIGWAHALRVTADGTGLVGHAGAILLRKAADQSGLTGQLSAALRRKGTSPLLDRGIVLVSLAAP